MLELIIYGINAVGEALRASSGEVKELLVAGESRRGRLGAILELARRRGVRISQCDRKSLNHLAGTTRHQNIAARIGEFRYCSLEEALHGRRESADYGEEEFERRLMVVLDHIEDPQNLGAIIRSADFFGAAGVVIPQRRAASVTPAVIRASAGAASRLPIVRVSNLAFAVEALRDEDFWIVGADPNEHTPLYGSDFSGIDIGLVIGNENRGISRLVREKCDFLFSIPRAGGVASLNASVAAGVMIYEILRQWGRDAQGD